MRRFHRNLMAIGLCFLISFLSPPIALALNAPSTPTNFSASALSTSEISLTWSSVSDATSYDIYRSTSSSGTYSYLDSVTTRRYTDTDLTSNKTYYYKIQAVNSAGSSPYSAIASATTYATFSNLSAKAIGSGQIYLSWNSVSRTTSYIIHRATSYSGTYTELARTTSTNYTDGNLTSGRTYYYQVEAVNSSGSNSFSEIASTTATGSSASTRITSDRLAGNNRYETSAKISQSGWDYSSYAIIVSGENYPDALCSAPLASKYNAPILLTSKAGLDPKTKAELSRLNVNHVFLIGGSGVIPFSAELEIKNMGISVSRIAGNNRYETSFRVAQTLGNRDQAIIATGGNFADALSIAPIAAMKGIPILLTPQDSLPSILKQYLENIQSTYIVGGTSAVSNRVLNQLPSPRRLSGTNRYETNSSILKEFANELNLGNCYLATGQSFPDALAGSALASLTNSPVVLISNPLQAVTIKYFKDNNESINKLITFGGTSVVPQSVINNILTGTTSIPSAPTNLTATAKSLSQIALSWSSVNGATSYSIYRATSSGGTYSLLSTVTSTSYTNTGLKANTTYYYKVRALSSAGSSPYSAVANAKTSISVPSVPSNFTASAKSSSQISLSWSAVSGATSYSIYRATSSSGTYSLLTTVTSTAYTNTGLAANTTYYYKIRAGNNAGSSSYSAVANATTFAAIIPSIPTNLTASAKSSSQIVLSWSAVSGATSYSIYRSTSSSGTYSLLTTVTSTAYTNSGLAANTAYYYKIRAVNSAGSSAYSATASATTNAGSKPPVPTKLTALALSSTQIALSWTAVDGATSYSVYTSTSPSGIYGLVSTVSSTSYTNTDLAANTTYYYKVLASNSAGSSSYSSEVSATTYPAAPRDLTATADSSSQITLTWSKIDGATSYSIYRSSSSTGTYTSIIEGVPSETYTDTGLSPKTAYYYKVKASNSIGSSDLSSEASDTTPAAIE